MTKNNYLRALVGYSCTMLIRGATEVPVGPVIEQKEEEKVNKAHITDSLNMLIYMSLLICVVLTIWLFKHRRLRFVHETGLAILYGLIVGAIIRYSSTGTTLTSEIVHLPANSSFGFDDPPDNLKLTIIQNNSKQYFQYDYKAEIDEKKVNEKELEDKATFDPEVFFNVLLPPIIFNAGYSLKRKSFFKNFGAIITFAFVGTAVSTFVVGGLTYAVTLALPTLGMSFKDCCFFGAIISATDPVTVLAIFSDLAVDMDLYALVFGESVLNDAVAIVLSKTVDDYDDSSGGFDGMAILRAFGNFLAVFLGAFFLGSAIGCLTAVLTKFTRIRDFPLLETALFFLMSYSSFLAAEAAELTGIVAVLFCGICQAHYTYHNLSDDSKLWTKQIFELMNFLMENFVFTYIGVSTFTFQRHYWDGAFIAAAFGAIIVARACNVYPLSFLLNLGRSNKIPFHFQHMMMFSGLRGAIAFALAIRNTSSIPKRTTFTTTLLIVILTVIVCGGLSTQMLQWLKIRVGVDDETEAQNFEAVRTVKKNGLNTLSYGSFNHPPFQSPSEPLPDVRQSHSARLKEKAVLVIAWYKVDARFVKPLLTHARPNLMETLPSSCKCLMPLARLLTTEEQLSPLIPHSRSRQDSDTDLIIDQDLAFGDHNGGIEAAAGGDVLPANHKQDNSLHEVPSHHHHIEDASTDVLGPSSRGLLEPADLAPDAYMTDRDPLLHRPTSRPTVSYHDDVKLLEA